MNKPCESIVVCLFVCYRSIKHLRLILLGFVALDDDSKKKKIEKFEKKESKNFQNNDTVFFLLPKTLKFNLLISILSFLFHWFILLTFFLVFFLFVECLPMHAQKNTNQNFIVNLSRCKIFFFFFFFFLPVCFFSSFFLTIQPFEFQLVEPVYCCWSESLVVNFYVCLCIRLCLFIRPYSSSSFHQIWPWSCLVRFNSIPPVWSIRNIWLFGIYLHIDFFIHLHSF